MEWFIAAAAIVLMVFFGIVCVGFGSWVEREDGSKVRGGLIMAATSGLLAVLLILAAVAA